MVEQVLDYTTPVIDYTPLDMSNANNIPQSFKVDVTRLTMFVPFENRRIGVFSMDGVPYMYMIGYYTVDGCYRLINIEYVHKLKYDSDSLRYSLLQASLVAYTKYALTTKEHLVGFSIENESPLLNEIIPYIKSTTDIEYHDTRHVVLGITVDNLLLLYMYHEISLILCLTDYTLLRSLDRSIMKIRSTTNVDFEAELIPYSCSTKRYFKDEYTPHLTQFHFTVKKNGVSSNGEAPMTIEGVDLKSLNLE